MASEEHKSASRLPTRRRWADGCMHTRLITGSFGAGREKRSNKQVPERACDETAGWLFVHCICGFGLLLAASDSKVARVACAGKSLPSRSLPRHVGVAPPSREQKPRPETVSVTRMYVPVWCGAPHHPVIDLIRPFIQYFSRGAKNLSFHMKESPPPDAQTRRKGKRTPPLSGHHEDRILNLG